MKQSVKTQQQELEEQEMSINDDITQLKRMQRVGVNYITPDDAEPRVIRKNLFSIKVENAAAVAHRLNASHIEPLAVIAQEAHIAVRQLDEIKNRLLCAGQEAEKYKELTQGLEETQIEKLTNQAEQFRQENQQKQDLERQKQREKSIGKGLSR